MTAKEVTRRLLLWIMLKYIFYVIKYDDTFICLLVSVHMGWFYWRDKYFEMVGVLPDTLSKAELRKDFKSHSKLLASAGHKHSFCLWENSGHFAKINWICKTAVRLFDVNCYLKSFTLLLFIRILLSLFGPDGRTNEANELHDVGLRGPWLRPWRVACFQAGISTK